MRYLVSSAVLCVMLSACGSSRTVPDGAQAGLRWFGNFQPTSERSSSIAPRGRHSATGSIAVVETRNSERVSVSMSVSSPGHQSTTLRWAVLPGHCGSASTPILSYQQFPVLEISGNGRGDLRVELPMTLQVTASYHANIYYGSGVQLDNVLACTNLRLR